MTGRMSEFGRLLDGLAGLITHVAIYVGVLWGMRQAGLTAGGVALVLVAACANVVHAQLYDYHRTAYEKLGLKQQLSPGALHALRMRTANQPALLALYERMARLFAGRHPEVEAMMARRAVGGVVSTADSTRYRALFYGPVRGWNLLGDNTRFYSVGVLALIGRVDWFPAVVLIGQNLALLVVSVWQRQRDAAFLEAQP
jgi:hypothetical protein